MLLLVCLLANMIGIILIINAINDCRTSIATMPLRVALDEIWRETKLVVVVVLMRRRKKKKRNRLLQLPFDRSILVVVLASLAIAEKLRRYVWSLQIVRALVAVDW